MSFAKWQRHSTFLSIAWADVDWPNGWWSRWRSGGPGVAASATPGSEAEVPAPATRSWRPRRKRAALIVRQMETRGESVAQGRFESPACQRAW